MKEKNRARKTILWWGRSDLSYSRNEILIQSLTELGFDIYPFRPRMSALGFAQALCKGIPKPDIIWVPSFRQRDFFAACHFARWWRVPLVFDPLISSYDKRVFEFNKLPKGSFRARRLKAWEQKMFKSADVVLADTSLHKEFFEHELGANSENCFVVPVGANQQLFTSQSFHQPNTPPEAFFYGSFLPLHGVETIIEAARLCPETRWTLLGGGTLREKCEGLAGGLSNLHFEDPVAYDDLPARIGRADIVLGVFGATPKAGRVIPNKVYQAMACGRPVVTRCSGAYPVELQQAESGLLFVPPEDPVALAETVRQLSNSEAALQFKGEQALKIFEEHFSQDHITELLHKALSSLKLHLRVT